MNQSEERKKLKSISLTWLAMLLFVELAFLLLALSLAAQARSREMKFYASISTLIYALYTFTIAQVIHRMWHINPSDDQPENSDCFKSPGTFTSSIIMNNDYYVQRWLLISLTYINFIISAESARRQEPFDEDLNTTNPDFTTVVYLYNILVGVSIIKGILINCYLLSGLIILCADYKEFSKEIIYHVFIQDSIQDEQRHRRNTVVKCITFCWCLMLYYLAKFILLVVIFDSDYTDVCLGMTVYTASFFFLTLKFVSYFYEIKAELNQENGVQVFDQNHECFQSWFTLLVSVALSRNTQGLLLLFYAVTIAQCLQIGIQLPLFRFEILMEKTSYSTVTYIFADSVVLQATLVKTVVVNLMRILNGERFYHLIYSFNQVYTQSTQPQSVMRVQPEGAGSQFQIIGANKQLPPLNLNNSDQLGECCFCLEQMFLTQKLRKLPCHETHIFHFYCISKWLINNNKCPLCQQSI